VIGAATTSRWARILLPAVLAAIAWSAAAGERCESHFPELRSFVERAGSRATPDADTAGVLIDELAVERALWDDEVARHRARLETAAAHFGFFCF